MTKEEWEELESIPAGINDEEYRTNRKRFYELLDKTKKVDEHPEGYNSACLCQLCCSYGD